MEKFWKFSPWLTRLLLLPPTVIFTLIAVRYLSHPVTSAAAQGITLNPGLGVTIARVGFGGFPLASALFLAICLLSRSRLLTGLSFVWILDAVILTVRVIGMNMDSTAQANMKLVNAEIGLLFMTSVGLFLELGRRLFFQRTHAAINQSTAA
jgi:hypothetical protein